LSRNGKIIVIFDSERKEIIYVLFQFHIAINNAAAAAQAMA
jgi:hypothetical protein